MAEKCKENLNEVTSWEAIDWKEIERDVVHRLRLLSQCWLATEKKESSDVHQKMVHDLYKPCLTYLAAFCAAVKFEDEKDISESVEAPPENPMEGVPIS